MRTLALCLLLAACEKPAIQPRFSPNATGASITVTSPAFTDGSRIPVDFTCDGKEAMPDLVLSQPPEGTKSLVIIVDDPDASAGVYTHMIAFNVAPETTKVPGGMDLTGVGDAARFGLNSGGGARYAGPCPPKGEGHRYRFRVIALDTMLKLPEGAPKSQIDEGMDGHILGEGSLMGHFGH
jgi:Raf kinase inhibitor-like YbhB/YbcL family protein